MIEQFLSYLESLDIKIWVEGEKLRYNAPKGVITSELLAKLREFKPEIIAFLQEKELDKSSKDIITIPIISRDSNIPLSFAQQRLWFLQQLEPQNTSYNNFAARYLRGKLNIKVLENSFNEIIDRHEILRVSFRVIDGQPLQIIAPKLTINIPIIDVRELSEELQNIKVQEIILAETEKPFDLTQSPLLRISLIKLAQETHILLFSVHHIVTDAWSMGILFRELSHLYNCFCDEKPHSLPTLSIQYVDFSAWQKNWLAGEIGKNQLIYWQEKLKNSPPSLNLPYDFTRPQIQTFRGKKEVSKLSKTLSDRLKFLSNQEGVTLFMLLLAGFKTLIYRYTGQEDIAIGTPIIGRNLSKVEELIGFFINTLVLRTTFKGNQTFKQLIKQVRQTALEAYTYQDIPFEKLVEELKPERDLSRTPFFQVWFNMINIEDISFNLSGVEVEKIAAPYMSSKFDLTIYLQEQPEGINIQWVYNQDLFTATTIKSLNQHFQNLLESLVTNPEQSLIKIPLLSANERQKNHNSVILNNPFIEFPISALESSIPDRFISQVKTNHDQLAIITNSHQWTYAKLDNISNCLAEEIINICDIKTDIIAILLETEAWAIASILSVLKTGKIYVPLDMDFPELRLKNILENSQAKVIITNENNIKLAQSLSEKIKIINIDEIDINQTVNFPNLSIKPHTPAYILYTSGSTGEPKGVLQNHGNILHFIRNNTNNLHISNQDRLTLFSGYNFDAAIIDIFSALLNGATLYPFNIKQEGFDNLTSWLIDHKITIYHSTSTVYRYWTDTLSNEKLINFSDIRLVILGGEEVLKKDVERYQEIFTDNCIFVNGLGCTESSFYLQYIINKKTEIIGHKVGVGYPLEQTEILLVNEEGINTEIYGEIAIKSPYIALEYWHNQQLTESAFLLDQENKRIYRTGDLGRLRPDGSIEFIGRKDFQVKIRGFRIELGEIETVLNRHPDVLNAVVIVRKDNEEDQQIIAYIISQSQTILTFELRQFLQQKLPDYMIPAGFVILEKFPLTPNGKINYRALPKPQLLSKETFKSPENELEEKLVKIWEKVLQIKPIGVQDNFFEIGGHSLLAVSLLNQIEQEFLIKLPLITIFKYPTIEEFAQVLTTKLEVPNWYSLVPIQPKGDRPILFGIHIFKFNDLSQHLGQEQPIYGLHYGIAQTINSDIIYPEKIEDLAAHYIKEMRLIQPQGPYFLMGLSLGGIIAYEMAQQLMADGQEIGLLALFDTYISFNTRQKQKRASLSQIFSRLWKLGFTQFWQKVKLRIIGKLNSIKAPDYKPQPQKQSLPYYSYKPQPYSGKIILFQAMNPSVFYNVNPAETGWRKYAKGELEIYSIPGNHVSILEEPGVKIIAEKLTHFLVNYQ